MTLFFDGVGILLAHYLRGRPERKDPAIAIPLREHSLLHIVEPEPILQKVRPTVTIAESSHEPENRLIERAQAADADYLVTGNTRHFPAQYNTTPILNPRQLLDVL